MIITDFNAIGLFFMIDITDGNWRFIPGTSEFYSISDKGIVRSNDRTIIYKSGLSVFYSGKILKPWMSTTGYKMVGIRLNGQKIKKSVHSLVCLTFIGDRPPNADIRHLDGNPLNNNLSNLCYGTRVENIQDTIKHGRMDNFNKLDKQKVLEICKLGFSDIKSYEVAKQYGVSRGTIVDIWNGRVCRNITDSYRPEHRGKIKYTKFNEEQLVMTYSLIETYSIPPFEIKSKFISRSSPIMPFTSELFYRIGPRLNVMHLSCST